jgi:hypothetical protein
VEEIGCGFGKVCCVTIAKCGQQTSAILSYFVNDDFPKPTNNTGLCEAVIFKKNPNICQLRISFESFNISGPVNGECKDNDTFIVSGHDRNLEIPQLCGVNTGHHSKLIL